MVEKKGFGEALDDAGRLTNCVGTATMVKSVWLLAHSKNNMLHKSQMVELECSYRAIYFMKD